jgi:hypothetical protein
VAVDVPTGGAHPGTLKLPCGFSTALASERSRRSLAFLVSAVELAAADPTRE